jgi:hypothetical protein
MSKNTTPQKTNGAAPPVNGSPHRSQSTRLSNDTHERPDIQVSNRQLRNITLDSLAALRQFNIPASLFLHAGRPVFVAFQENDRHVISEAHPYIIRNRLTQAADFFKITKEGQKDCAPPLDVVHDLLAILSSESDLPPLEGIVEAPVLRPDGTILRTPGYDEQTGLYYAPSKDLRIPDIPEEPTTDDVDVAMDELRDVIHDFPFTDEASETNAHGSMITPIVRAAIRGPVPLALIDATTAGSGKTLLSEIISLIISGHEPALFAAPYEENDWRKQITAMLRKGYPVAVVDNLCYTLNSAELCRAISATTYGDRILGTSETVDLPVRCTWIATGNNIQLGGDMPRRTYWVRMDPKCSKAHQRTGFKYERLKEYVLKHRGELLARLLTISRAWFSAGQPKSPVNPLGSFEEWSRIVGGILHYARAEKFLANSDQLYDQTDIEGAQWEVFLQTIHSTFEGKPFTTSELWDVLWPLDGNKSLRECLPDSLAPYLDKRGQLKQRLGMAFRGRIGRRYGASPIRIERHGEESHVKVACWRVEKDTE